MGIVAKCNMTKWDKMAYDMVMACESMSTCLRNHVGAVIMRDNTILSTGYNGSPKGCEHCETSGCIRQKENIPSGQRHECCNGAHAEQNAICQAAANGVNIFGSTIYSSCSPCSMCAKSIINSGIKHIVTFRIYPDERALLLLEQAGVDITYIKIPLKEDGVKKYTNEEMNDILKIYAKLNLDMDAMASAMRKINDLNMSSDLASLTIALDIDKKSAYDDQSLQSSLSMTDVINAALKIYSDELCGKYDIQLAPPSILYQHDNLTVKFVNRPDLPMDTYIDTNEVERIFNKLCVELNDVIASMMANVIPNIDPCSYLLYNTNKPMNIFTRSLAEFNAAMKLYSNHIIPPGFKMTSSAKQSDTLIIKISRDNTNIISTILNKPLYQAFTPRVINVFTCPVIMNMSLYIDKCVKPDIESYNSSENKYYVEFIPESSNDVAGFLSFRDK